MAQTRITGGDWRGRLIDTPPGLKVRPTRGMVREAIFNILGPAIRSAKVVDLYAGAGTLGFESLSRGASEVTFVDSHRSALQMISGTAQRLGCSDRCELIQGDALAWLREGPAALKSADVCFMDAPYRDQELEAVLKQVAALAPHLIVCEHHRRREMPADLPGYTADAPRHYGITGLTIYRRLGE